VQRCKKKYLKYKQKYLELKSLKKLNLNGGTKPNILYLDFDETLGSFNICYSFLCKLLNHYVSQETLALKSQLVLLKKELLKNYHLRPGLELFFKKLQELKTNEKINQIVIMSRNSDLNNYPGYFEETINLMLEITETPGLIDRVVLGVRSKNLNDSTFEKIYIVDDKPEHVNPI